MVRCTYSILWCLILLHQVALAEKIIAKANNETNRKEVWATTYPEDMAWLPTKDVVPLNGILDGDVHSTKAPHDDCLFKSYSNNFTGYEYVLDVQKACEEAGEVCKVNFCGKRGPFFRNIEKKVNCKKLWQNDKLDPFGKQDHPPNWAALAPGVRDMMSYGGHVHVAGPHKIKNNKYYGATALVTSWTTELLDDFITKSDDMTLKGQYGVYHTILMREMLDTYAPARRTALVVGSETPWVESILLAIGFEHVTTLEYGKIVCNDPRISTYQPEEFRDRVLNGLYAGDQGFDVVVSYSSVEHSGLGRYGDSINPYADLITIARMHCITKPGGRLFLTVPMNKEVDKIYFNGHRIYGDMMLANLLANWEQVAGPRIFPHSMMTIPRQCTVVVEKPKLKPERNS